MSAIPNQGPLPGLELISHPDDASVIEGLTRLEDLDARVDEEEAWSEPLWDGLRAVRAPLWAIAKTRGGDGLGRLALVRRNALLAQGSLTGAFILTQHDAAVRRLTGASEKGHPGASDLLDRIASGDLFVTVGLSQLTTSRRRGPRALAASERPGGGFRLDGSMPWVTAAPRADWIVGGAVLENGEQILAMIPTDRPGVHVDPPMPLAALGGSCTTEVHCKGVEIEPGEVLFGPSPDVLAMASGGGGTGGLETSALAVGQAWAAIEGVRQLAETREDLEVPLEALEASWAQVAEVLLAAAEGRAGAMSPAEIRRRANDLALRTTQAYLTARKGTGFLRTEPAQRYARQALFFLVWSCPAPVAQAALLDFAGLCPP